MVVGHKISALNDINFAFTLTLSATGFTDLYGMETRTPETYAQGNSSSSSSVRGRHGCVVLRSGSDVHISLGSTSNLDVKVTQHHRQNDHPDHQFQQQQHADITEQEAKSDKTEVRGRARSPPRHVMPSAPGQETLLRPWSDRPTPTSTCGPSTMSQDLSEQTNLPEIRPPAFNPDCSVNTSVGTCSSSHVYDKASEAALDDSQLVGSGSVASGGGQNDMPPPSYDEIFGDQTDRQCHSSHRPRQQRKQQQQTSTTARTTSEQSAVVCISTLPYVTEFGQYTDPSVRPHPQPGRFVHPTRISVRDDKSGSPAIMVVDRGSSAVQVFTLNGACLASLQVPRVNGGCFIGRNPVLLLAVGTLVSVYELDGRLVKEIPLRGRQQDDAVLTTVPYGERGFVAVRSRSLSICRGGIARPAVVHTVAGRYRVDRGTTPFVNVVDVAVDSTHGHLVVLDAASPSVSGHRSAVYVMTEDGAVLRAIRPARDTHCGPLLRPFGVAVDREGNVLVSDATRLVRFSAADGSYMATLIGADNATVQRSDGAARVRGIAVCAVERDQVVFVVLTGDRFAQIRAFSLQS